MSEYLVPPPPPPRFQPPGRVARLVTPSPTEAPGYFRQFINWLNPFGSSPQTLSPPPPPHIETPYSPSPKFMTPSAPAEIYGGPSPTSSLNYARHISENKGRNCNSCNKVPWIPIPHDEFSHSEPASFAPPPPPPSQLTPSLNGEYPPPRNHEISYDAYHAASQEVRVPDFSFAPPLLAGQDGALISPLPNPHLYPGAIPPLYKSQDFNYPVQAVPSSNSEYLDAPISSSSGFEDILSAGNDSFSSHTELKFNNGAPVYPHPSNSDREVAHQEYTNLIASNPTASNGGFEHLNAQNYGTHGDLSPSDTQISHDHSNLLLDKQRLENTATQSLLDSISYQTSFSGVSIDQNPSSSYGISGLDQIPGNLEHQYDDLSSSANVAEDSRAPLRVTDGSSAKSEDSIHFEESLLLDFTNKSRTDSSPIPPTSNTLADSTNTAGKTLAHDNEAFGTRHDITTESYFPADRFQTNKFVTPSEESRINDGTAQRSNEGLHDDKILRGQDVSYIPPTGQVGYLWPKDLSTTSRNTDSRKHSLKSISNTFDDAEEMLNENNVKDANKTSTKQLNEKSNKQVI